MTRTVNVGANGRPINASPDRAAAGLTLLAANVAMAVVIVANFRPYRRLAEGVIQRSLGFRPWWLVSAAIGAIVQLGIQAAEVRPLLLNRPNLDQYRRAATIAALAYVADISLALYNWPPLNVSLARFWVTRSLSDVNPLNVGMIIATVYGPELLVRLTQAIVRDLDTNPNR